MTVLDVRRALGRCVQFPARVRFALFSLWCNVWVTGDRARFWLGDSGANGCRFCGLGPDRVKHYFGVNQPQCVIIGAAFETVIGDFAPSCLQ